MDWKLEVVVVPVADQDVAKEFYMEKVGFGLDVDHRAGESFRVVQLTPPGSPCSITLMKMPDRAGSLSGLQVVVSDIDAAREQLVAGGAGPTDLFHFADGEQLPGPDPERQDYGTFFAFRDPDGNQWLVQEVPSRAAG